MRKLELLLQAPERGNDAWGAGHFGAPRGTRLHVGVDYAALPGSRLLSPVHGTVTKLGYPYGDDLSFRYVEVTDTWGLRHRFFYVKPLVRIGERIEEGDVLGEVQDIVSRYPDPPGMKPHFHYEIKDQHGDYLAPEEVWD